MPVKVSGDFAKVEQWEKLFENGDAVLPVLSSAMAEDVIGLIKDGFRDQKDPYGKRWAKKKISDGRKVLSGMTSRLKGGWHRRKADKGGFTVSPSVDYATPHQDPKMKTGGGGLKRPRRLMVPTSGKGLPASWARQLEETAEEIMAVHFGSGGGGGGIGFVAAKIAAVRRNLGIKMIIRRAITRAAGD